MLYYCTVQYKYKHIKAGLPVPHESITPTRSAYGSLRAIDWKMPSAIVDRQMLPRHTKRTLTLASLLMVIRGINR